MTRPPLLTLHNLRHDYGSGMVLNISRIALAAGEIALLSGDNGSGKSTLLRIIAGIVKPRHCAAFDFNGKAAAAPPAAVYLHQTPYLFSTSVRGNVQYGLRCCGLPLAAAEDAMQWAGVAHLADSAAARLSGGEQRRVALARVRALRPALYLLDEPLAHLDHDGKQRMHTLLSTLQQEGATAIISSHYQDLPATTIWQLKNGDIKITGCR